MVSRISSLGSLLVLSTLGACAVAPADAGVDEVGRDEAPEVWNDANNPSFVDTTFVYDAATLPLEGGLAVAPIAADYWATYRDSINAKWDGAESLSPAAKYAKAFLVRPGASADEAASIVKGFEDRISAKYGIDAQRGRKECTDDSECDDLHDGSACAVREGAEKGRCIPGWWGICHGWAPYAYNEPAARNPVTENGVTFYAGDLEALMSLVYSDASLGEKFLSERCNRDDSAPSTAPARDRLNVGPDGRVIDAECRDMNPGSWHVLVANMLGLRKAGFVYDRTFDDQVWNQPVRDFRVTNADAGKLKEVSKSEAIRLVGGTGNTYRHNTRARRFFHVQMDFRFIREPHGAMRTPANPDEYTATDRFEYVLETDGRGRIQGGEWVGASRTRHPDFAWWNTRKPTNSPVVSYANVKKLNDLAAAR